MVREQTPFWGVQRRAYLIHCPARISQQEETTTLDIHRILAELKAERDRIEQAIAAIGSIGSRRARRGRPPGRPAGGRKRKRRLTPEGRKRLSEMMKKRWAERRKKAKGQ